MTLPEEEAPVDAVGALTPRRGSGEAGAELEDTLTTMVLRVLLCLWKKCVINSVRVDSLKDGSELNSFFHSLSIPGLTDWLPGAVLLAQVDHFPGGRTGDRTLTSNWNILQPDYYAARPAAAAHWTVSASSSSSACLTVPLSQSEQKYLLHPLLNKATSALILIPTSWVLLYARLASFPPYIRAHARIYYKWWGASEQAPDHDMSRQVDYPDIVSRTDRHTDNQTDCRANADIDILCRT